MVRTEIEEEVNRVNAAMAQKDPDGKNLAEDFWQPSTASDLGHGPGDLGGGI